MTHAQLVGLGITARQVEVWIARGDLQVLHRGVYLVGPIAPPHAHETAAVLACGPSAVLSHHSAAHLYQILPYPARPGPVHVTVTERHTRVHRGVQVHRTTTLAPHELRERSNIPLTAVPRTLIDLAACADPFELEAAVAEAFALRLTSRGQLLRAIDDAVGRRGAARLRALLDGERGPKRTRSAPERKLLAAIRAAGFPEPEVNSRLGRWEVDLYWPEQALVVEVDGFAAHSSPRAFERDRQKGAELEDMGIRLLRVSALQVRDRRQATVARIDRALERS